MSNVKMTCVFFWNFHLMYSPEKFVLFTKMQLLFFYENECFIQSFLFSSSIYNNVNTSTTMNNQVEVRDFWSLMSESLCGSLSWWSCAWLEKLNKITHEFKQDNSRVQSMNSDFFFKFIFEEDFSRSFQINVYVSFIINYFVCFL